VALLATVPGIMSWTATEASVFIAGGAARFDVTEEQVKARIAAQYNIDATRAAAVWDGYHLDDPTRTPWETLAAVATDALSKTPMRKSAEARASVGQQPVFVSEFTWPSRAEGGLLGAPHGIDIPFAFGNIGQDRNTEGAGADATETSRNQMAIFTAFIRAGDPNNARVPAWSPYDAARRPTMVINERCELVPDYRSGDRRTADTLPIQDTSQLMAGPLFRG
jgi:para-nitrobenzyl esterase